MHSVWTRSEQKVTKQPRVAKEISILRMTGPPLVPAVLQTSRFRTPKEYNFSRKFYVSKGGGSQPPFLFDKSPFSPGAGCL